MIGGSPESFSSQLFKCWTSSVTSWVRSYKYRAVPGMVAIAQLTVDKYYFFFFTLIKLRNVIYDKYVDTQLLCSS